MTPPLKLVKAGNTQEIERDIHEHLPAFEKFREELTDFIRGKDALVESVLCAILSSGHVLIEDVPGVGKTTVIKGISRLLGLEMRRVQCTSDLLPSDIIGVEVFSTTTQQFEFHKGPVFSNIVLADELNRASPRTQSALLEAMGEGFVTVDRQTYELPKPFILFAAQNPSDHIGTYPLPESQLDRFSVKLRLDYPAPDKETEIFQRSEIDPLLHLTPNVITKEALEKVQYDIESVFISPRVASYVERFVQATRQNPSLKRGVSTRGGVTWLRVARARAMLNSRTYVIPDDLLAMGSASLSHRVIPQTGNDPKHVIEHLLNTVEIE